MDGFTDSVELPGRAFVDHSVTIDGTPIRYAQAGQGRDIVMLPTSSGLMFSQGADRLATHFRVTMIEPPGWGESPPEQKSKPIPELAHTTAAVISAIGIDRFYLTGSSIGGIHAMWVAALYPERVRALILDASMGFRKDHWSTPGFDPVAFVRAAEDGADISGMLPKPHPRKPWATLEFRERQMRRILRVMALTGPEYDEDLAARLRPLSIPLLALYGENDHHIFASAAENYKGIFKNCKTMTIENAAHDIPGELPELYDELVTTFIDGLNEEA